MAPSFFTTGASAGDNLTNLKRYLMLVAILDSVREVIEDLGSWGFLVVKVVFLLVLTISDEPPTPPSLSAAEEKVVG